MDLVHKLAILEASPAAVGHVHLRLARPPSFVDRPGQYVMAELPGDERARPLALAGRSDAPHVELLVRTPDDARDALIDRVRDGEARLSEPGGPGWRLDDAGDRPVWGICVGSGISALRGLLDERSETAPERTGLVYGVRSDDYLCFPDDLAAWRGRGLTVETPLSPTRVQHRVAELVPANALCLLVGMREMVDETRAALEAAGVAPDDIRMNF